MPLQSEHFHRLKVLLCQYKYIVIVFILIILYFSFNTIYINFFLHVGKPAYIGDIQGSNQPFFYSLDKFQEIRYEGQQIFQLIGWAFPKEIYRPLADYHKQLILIDENSEGYYFDSTLMIRKGVTSFYKDLGINLDQSGFSVNISKYVLPKGKYNIAFLFSLSDGSEPLLYRTNYYLNRTANNLQYIHEK